ncbi:hypothetical protein COO58_17630 [Micromonospora sp. WMMA1996]|uniref:hypothetical protein n=1 Tax=Micromonospora sp. WMMA1996 TaxID=2039878 RepID=UPI000BF5B5F6|nr:hypothetical protein [Micromonospora sp. WMMA1996]PGH46029.1 hypothetical protein COO58_17630 [Micromonospora sp. WMMA1996]
MASSHPSDRVTIASLAAHLRWAQTEDRAAATAPARRAFNDRFEKQVDPEGKLSPAERARRAESARKAYFARLALKSAQTRRAKAARKAGAQDAA